MTASVRPVAPARAEQQLSDADQHEIQVSGQRCFPMNEWRNAIEHYLFGVWGNKDEVMFRSKINFGGVSLRLDQSCGEYYAIGQSPDADLLPFSTNGVLSVGCWQLEVEQGLIRFAKNEEIRMLVITFRNHGVLKLWKTDRRGEYRCHSYGIPSVI